MLLLVEIRLKHTIYLSPYCGPVKTIAVSIIAKNQKGKE